jgi:ABC-2 type transport system ATP-binding protein
VPGDAAIETTGLRKTYGNVTALDGIDLYAPQGSVLGLLGPNGAGKTTAVRILTTLLPPDAGQARVAGLDVVRDAAALRAQIGLAGRRAVSV